MQILSAHVWYPLLYKVISGLLLDFIIVLKTPDRSSKFNITENCASSEVYHPSSIWWVYIGRRSTSRHNIGRFIGKWAAKNKVCPYIILITCRSMSYLTEPEESWHWVFFKYMLLSLYSTLHSYFKIKNAQQKALVECRNYVASICGQYNATK